MTDDLRDKWLAIDPHHRGMVMASLRRYSITALGDAVLVDATANSEDERGSARRMRAGADAFMCAADILAAMVVGDE